MSKNYFFLLLFIFIIMTIYYINVTKKKATNEINEYKKLINEINNNLKSNEPITNNLQSPPVTNNLQSPPVTNNLQSPPLTNNLQPQPPVTNNVQPRTALINNLPVRQLLEYRDRSVLYDPLVAPERRIDMYQYPLPILNKINIPSRGYPDNYQIMGLLSRPGDEKILQLFGRATFPGSNQYEYYVTTETNGFANKIPIETKGKREVEDGALIKVPIFDQNKGDFQVKLYNYDTPRYNPYIF